MKTILIAYADQAGRVLAEVMDIESSAEQARVFDDAKRNHRFPKSVQRLEFCHVTPVDTAIFISEASAKEIQEGQSARFKHESAERAANAAHQKAAANVQNATTAYFAAARKRNDLVSKVANLKNRMVEAGEIARTSKTKESKDSLLEYEKLHDAAIDELKAAEAAFADAKAVKETINAPVSTKPKK